MISPFEARTNGPKLENQQVKSFERLSFATSPQFSHGVVFELPNVRPFRGNELLPNRGVQDLADQGMGWALLKFSCWFPAGNEERITIN